MPFEEVELGAIALAGDAGLVDGPFGSNLPASDYVAEGVPVIRGSNLSKGACRFKGDDFVFVSEPTADRLARSICLPSDIIFTKKGTLGQVGIVPPKPYDKYLLSSNQMRLRVDETVANADFVYYALSTKESISRIVREAEHTGVPKINLAYIRRFQIPFPPRAVQEQICSFVRVLDDRIDLLRDTNATLEAIAQALFKSWFVDFDPVRAKSEGRDPIGVPPEVSDLFPSEFEDSELGVIPKGWRVKPFADAVEILGGGTPKTSEPSYWGGCIPWFSVVDAPALGQVFTVTTEKSVTDLGIQNSSARVLPVWTTVISARGTVGKLALTGVEMAMNQSCYGLRTKTKGGEVLTYLSAQRLVDTLKRLAHGGVFDTITRATLASVNVCDVPANLIEAFDSATKPLFERILSNNMQAGSLTDLRDTLLPRLMSGKLRIPETQEAIEEATA